MIDLYAGLGGWAEGGVAEGYEVVGFDIERHEYGAHRYPAQLVLQDVLTIHGRQFKHASLIVASPPCQEYSYMAMPWSIAKQKQRDYEDGTRDRKQLTALFDACFRIQQEASEAAGRYIPLVVENVRGAQKWVGQAKANYGSFFLWGDVESVGGRIVCGHQIRFGAALLKAHKAAKVPGFRFDGSGGSFQTAAVEGTKLPGNNGPVMWSDREIQRLKDYPVDGLKNSGGSWFNIGSPGQAVTNQNPVHKLTAEGVKGSEGYSRSHPAAFGWKKPNTSSHSKARKHASAMIAKIPLTLARHIAASWHPRAA